jgi:tetratricopeptide (TPR) repeat protein
VLIERYTRIALSQPGASFPLQRLAQLYRERDGNIAKLVTDFESRAAAAGADQYPATVTLAGLYKIDGRADDSIKTYEKAITLKPTDSTAILSLAHLFQDRGDLADARSRYEKALPLLTVQADKETTVRAIMSLALDQKDWTAAKTAHKQLVALEPTSLFVKAELGHELYNRGEFAQAEIELKDVVAAAAGDNRALAPALKELGRAQAKAHENVQALATLKRALATAGEQSALRAEIYEIVTEIYRADQRLPELVKQLEDEHPGDFARLALLGGLYEETGDSTRAIDTYKRALAQQPRQIDIRLRMIRLLQANGDLDKAIAEYDGLIRAAPNNPQFVFEECEALLQRGDRARALKLVTELEARGGSDEEVLARVADFYARIGENEKSLKVLQRLAQASSGDPGHLVDLGDRYYQDGDPNLAVATWKRILAVVQPRAKALAALGDVYLEHDMVDPALAAYKEAVQLEPGNLATKKSLASAYERKKQFHESRVLYEEIVAKAKEKGDKGVARECRTRIVSLWGLERILEQQVPALERQFRATPPDVEAGRMLAEAQLHLRKLGDAEGTLRRVIETAPGDADSYLALERVLVQENKIADAIAVLEKLAVVEPKRARELYQRMAQYALQIYKDDDAIKYAARAVELNPDDAEGHRRLGEMYRSKQDGEHAIAEFRAAITKNDRLFVVYFELADLLLAKGQTDEADRLFRRVVRGAPDEELVARAARLSMQINLGKGTLESLEQDLLPMAIGEPQKPIYRRLLVEIYGSLTFGLVQRVRHGTAQDADDARAALAHIGSRAVKPLLDALADQDSSQQRIAIDVLAYVQNRNAAVPLFAFATGPADAALRTRAMVACGSRRRPVRSRRVSPTRSRWPRRGGWRGCTTRRRSPCCGGLPTTGRRRCARSRCWVSGWRTTRRRCPRWPPSPARWTRGTSRAPPRRTRWGIWTPRPRSRCSWRWPRRATRCRGGWRWCPWRGWRRRGRKSRRGSGRRCRRCPTRCSPGPTKAPAGRPRRTRWRGRRCRRWRRWPRGATGPIARRRRRCCRCRRGRSTWTSCWTRWSRATCRRRIGRRRWRSSASRSSGRRWRRCGRRASGRAPCWTRWGAARGSCRRSWRGGRRGRRRTGRGRS